METPKKHGYGWSVTLPVLVLLAGLQTSAAQTCPVGCSGCGTDIVDCSNAGLTSFPQLPPDAQQRVQMLDLAGNKLVVLEPTDLENYINLDTLFLNGNQLTKLPEGLFSFTTQLSYLDLRENQLTVLPEGLLSATTELYYLGLSNNQLTELSKNLFSATTELEYLELDGNPLHCDCNLSWLAEFLRGTTEYKPATCATPADLAGESVASLSEDEFVCDQSLQTPAVVLP